MNFLGLIVTVACFTSSQQAPQMIAFEQRDAIVKRQAASYSTNVIHHNPKYTDGQAESSVQFEFHTAPQVKKSERDQREQRDHREQRDQRDHRDQREHRDQLDQQSDQDYAYTRQQQPQTQFQYTPQKQIATYKTPTYSAPQSQAVNVGYSVSFAGPSKSELKSNQYTKQNYDDSDIITGYRKEVVRQPTHDFEPKDFVNNALEKKKQRLSGIKQKQNVYSTTSHNNDGKNFINNLSPKTIEHLSKLGVSKPNDVIQHQQQQLFKIKTTDGPNAESVTSPWVNLSPYVELYRSDENKRQQTYKNQIQQNPLNNMFGKPQVFDFTNVVETQAQRSPHNHADSDRRPYGREEKVRPNVGASPQEEFQITYDESAPMENFGHIKPLPLIQMPAAPQFNIDTSLLRNAGVTAQTSPNLISIPMDTSLYEAMHTKIMESLQQNPNKNLFQPHQQNYQAQQSQQVQQIQKPKQPKKEEKRFLKHPDHKFPRTEIVDSYLPQTQFYNSQFNNQFDSHFDNVKVPENKFENVKKQSQSIRPKVIKGVELHRDLQPPPENTRRRRLIITV